MAKSVIQLKPSQDKNELQPILPIKEQKKYCTHPQTELDKDERTLECKVCGKFIDPFDWMLDLAYKERNYFGNIEIIKQKMEQLNKEYEQLQREVNNLKATKRRLLK